MVKPRRGRGANQKRAQQHIDTLEIELDKQRYLDRKLAQRYVDLIRRVGMKFRVALPRRVKRQYCKHCKTLFYPGQNSRLRFRKGVRVAYCYNCKNYTRCVYKGKQSTNRRA